MRKNLVAKIVEALFSVLPVAVIILILYFTPLVSFTTTELIVFLVSTLFLILGIALFNLGADLAMTPMGSHIGSGLTKSKNKTLLLTVAFVMGVVITIAEPDLSVLAEQLKGVLNGTVLIIAIGVGVGIFLTLAVLKVIFKSNLTRLLFFFYMILFALAGLVIERGNDAFIAMCFDSGGVTTGPITVPFIMAVGVGVAGVVGGKNAEENSFGLIALCSVGPILAVVILSMFIGGGNVNISTDYSLGSNVGRVVLDVFLTTLKDVGIALGLIVVIFAVLNFLYLKLPKKKLKQIAVGIAYTFVGLIVFLTAVNVGYMPIGYKLGKDLAECHDAVMIVFAFILGMVTVLAEPAIHVLNKQIETVTAGMVKRRSMLIALSVGVGLAIALSVIRIRVGFSILYYLVPGYTIALGLSFFVPSLYTAIAFDSGGVASGPLTSGFILPMAVGLASVLSSESILQNAFGIVAMVAMTPPISIQLLGFRSYVAKNMKDRKIMKRILSSDDKEIIDFI